MTLPVVQFLKRLLDALSVNFVITISEMWPLPMPEPVPCAKELLLDAPQETDWTSICFWYSESWASPSTPLSFRNAYTSDMLSDRKSTRLNSSHPSISYAVFCLKKKKKKKT